MSKEEIFMARAFELARLQHGRTGKNPSVGCVLVDRDGNKLAEAATGDGGALHAEEIALAKLPKALSQGGTAYVTLEPCHTRTHGGPSCAERLIQSGISRVVVATRDEHPQGNGGIDRLIRAGITVEAGILGAKGEALYADFFAVYAKET